MLSARPHVPRQVGATLLLGALAIAGGVSLGAPVAHASGGEELRAPIAHGESLRIRHDHPGGAVRVMTSSDGHVAVRGVVRTRAGEFPVPADAFALTRSGPHADTAAARHLPVHVRTDARRVAAFAESNGGEDGDFIFELEVAAPPTIGELQ